MRKQRLTIADKQSERDRNPGGHGGTLAPSTDVPDVTQDPGDGQWAVLAVSTECR